MHEGDLPEVARIERETYLRPWPAWLFRRLLREGLECWVMETEGIVRGYGIMAVRYWAHILNLCVAERCRRQGFGRRILNQLLLIARERQARGAWLEVRPTGRAAIRLYRSMGFKKQGRHKHYYREGGLAMDAFIMTLPFRRSFSRALSHERL